VGKTLKGNPTTPKDAGNSIPPAAEKAPPTPSANEERMEVEPLPQREGRVRASSMPIEGSPLINVENTPMEVALEESRDQN